MRCGLSEAKAVVNEVWLVHLLLAASEDVRVGRGGANEIVAQEVSAVGGEALRVLERHRRAGRPVHGDAHPRGDVLAEVGEQGVGGRDEHRVAAGSAKARDHARAHRVAVLSLRA